MTLQGAARSGLLFLLAELLAGGCQTTLPLTETDLEHVDRKHGVVYGSVIVEIDPPDASGIGQAYGDDRAAERFRYRIEMSQFACGPGAPPDIYWVDVAPGVERSFVGSVEVFDQPETMYDFTEMHVRGLHGAWAPVGVRFYVRPQTAQYLGRIRIRVPHRIHAGAFAHATVEDASESALAELRATHPELEEHVVIGAPARVEPWVGDLRFRYSPDAPPIVAAPFSRF